MNIEALRLSKSLTQKELADTLGVSRSTVAMWESGRASPTAKKMTAIAGVFGCTVDELLREPEPASVCK